MQVFTKHHLALDVSKPKRGTSINGGDEPVDEQLSVRTPCEIQVVKKIRQKKITIDVYLSLLMLNDKQLKKLNQLRKTAGVLPIEENM